MTPEEEKYRRLLSTHCKTRDELWAWVYLFLDLDLPGCIVDENSNCTPLGMVFECYSHFLSGNEKVSRALYYASRDGGKTLSQSVIEVMALLHFDTNLIHLAAIEEQSRNAIRYVKSFFMKPYIRGFVEGDNKRESAVVYYKPIEGDGIYLNASEFKELTETEKNRYEEKLHRLEIVVATVASVNGKHGNLFLDEIDVLSNPLVYEEAKNIPSPIRRKDGTVQMPLTVLTSTRKSAFGLVQKELDEKEKTGLIVRHWNLIDVTERCPATRHRPDLPKIPIYRNDDELTAVSESTYKSFTPKEREPYKKDVGFQGCLSNCKLWAACKGRLATHQTSDSSFLKPLQHTENQFRNNSIEMAKAQLLCLKPASTGLVYPRLDRQRHVITPAEAYARMTGQACSNPKLTKLELIHAIKDMEVRWFGGLDFGYTHNTAYVHMAKIGNRGFVTHCAAMAGLEPDQILGLCEPFKAFEPRIYADTEDPRTVAALRKAGFRMAEWKKLKGSVIAGINAVRLKLSPPLGGEPELFFVREIESDPLMDLLIKRLSEYHWKTDAAGRVTDIPDEAEDDECDAFRYLIMNVFDAKGKFQMAMDTKPADKQKSQIDNWLQDEIETNLAGTGADPDIAPQETQVKRGRFNFQI